MAQWPHLATWPLPHLLRLQASWQQIMPQTAAEQTAHDANMREIQGSITQQTHKEAEDVDNQNERLV